MLFELSAINGTIDEDIETGVSKIKSSSHFE